MTGRRKDFDVVAANMTETVVRLRLRPQFVTKKLLGDNLSLTLLTG